jgi:hypothetical protein
MDKRPALGKGLSALIPDAPEPVRTSPFELDIDRLTPNSYQPRGQFDDARLDDLANSIKSNGVIQPIVVRKVGDSTTSSRVSAGGARRRRLASPRSRWWSVTSRLATSARSWRWR